MMIFPTGAPSAVMSKKTLVVAIVLTVGEMFLRVSLTEARLSAGSRVREQLHKPVLYSSGR